MDDPGGVESTAGTADAAPSTADAAPSTADAAYVERCLGRRPQSAWTVAARDQLGRPTVICNAPFLDDGTPMPTRYWLVDPDLVRRIGGLESTGGVKAAEAEVDPDALAAAHADYAAARDRAIPADHRGPRPSGGVGGTRRGVKCLHTHYAWYLAGGADPVGAWVAERLHPQRSPASAGDEGGVEGDAG